MTSELEKAQLGAKTFEEFCQQFGEDVHSHVLIEVLLDLLTQVPVEFLEGDL